MVLKHDLMFKTHRRTIRETVMHSLNRDFHLENQHPRDDAVTERDTTMPRWDTRKCAKNSDSGPEYETPGGSSLSMNEDGTLRLPPESSRPESTCSTDKSRSDWIVDDMIDMKCEVMANWLQQQQTENSWSFGGPNEGVVLKRRAHDFIACPATLARHRNGYFDAIRQFNVKVSLQNASCSVNEHPMLIRCSAQ